MSIESIRAALPEYAKDLKLNLGSIVTTKELSTQQLWGTILASAAATKVTRFFTEISEEARENLSEQAYDAALGAASIMAMNNVFYRGRAFLDGSYDDLRPSLRMNIIGKPGVEKADFELWSFAVSAINGCAHCLHAHDKALQEAGVARESIFESLRIAAIIAGAAQAYALVTQ